MSLPGWLADPDLARVWAVLRDRVETRGLRPAGRAVLSGLSRPERHAVSALLGRPVTSERIAVDLAELDTRLAERSGAGGLLAVLAATTGAPLRDRPAARRQRADRREAPLMAAQAAIAADPVLATLPWVPGWLDGIRRSGLLARPGDTADVLVVAVAVLSRLLGQASAPSGPGAAGGNTSRTDLAARFAGGAHALDGGTTLGQVVLRGLAAASAEQVPTTTAARRQLWERFGVATDEVSSTCLTLGLRPSGSGSLARRMRMAADAGDPVHLMPWDLRRRAPLSCVGGTSVLVCENPRVLEAVAQRYGGAVAVVCVAGQPAMVVLDVLARMAGGGAALRYHGDFDWPGIAIANRLIRQVGVRPWRMAATDYERCVATGSPANRLALAGRPVEPAWDPELGAAMRRRGIAVHEEAVLDDLLAALRG